MMRKILAILLFCISGALSLQAEEKIKTVVIKTKINCDHCSQCGSCGARLENALYDKKGIKRVDVDDKAMIISVVYHTEKISIDDIRNTIAASGYDADEVKAQAAALANLDACCRSEE